MGKLAIPKGTVEEKVAWIKSLSLDDLKELAAGRHPGMFQSDAVSPWLAKLIQKKEHFENHLHEGCILCEHQKHLVEGCRLCEEERRHG